MKKTLQQIKNEVAIELGYKSNSVFSAHEQIVGSTYKVLSNSIDQVAIRYAQEQKRELVDMLEQVLKDYYNIIPNSDARDNRINQIEELITKHKQS